MINYSIKAVAREDKKDSQGKAPVAIRIIVNRKITYRSLGYKVDPNEFDKIAQEVSTNVPNWRLINADIKKHLAELEASMLEHRITGGEINQHSIKTITKKDNDGDFCKFLDEWIEHSKKVKARGTIRYMQMDLAKFKVFSGGSIHFSQVTHKFLEEFESWLVDKQGLAHNTAWRVLKTIRTAFNVARRDGATKHYPFNTFKLKYNDTIKGWLELDEIETLYKAANKPGQHPTLSLVGWYWLLGAYTGMRFQDLERVPTGELVRGEKIVCATLKTGEIVSINIHKRIRELLDKIGTRHIMSNQKANDYIKVLARDAELKDPDRVHFHLARHTFGTLSLELGIDITTVQKILGHRSIKTTGIYAKISDKLVKDAMIKWEATYNNVRRSKRDKSNSQA